MITTVFIAVFEAVLSYPLAFLDSLRAALVLELALVVTYVGVGCIMLGWQCLRAYLRNMRYLPQFLDTAASDEDLL